MTIKAATTPAPGVGTPAAERLEEWADQASRLSDRYTCVRYDCRGHTRSARGRAPISTAVHADDAAALIDALGLAPTLLVSSSGGAVIGVDVAMRQGERLRGAVFSEPPLFSLDDQAREAAMADLRPIVEQAASVTCARRSTPSSR